MTEQYHQDQPAPTDDTADESVDQTDYAADESADQTDYAADESAAQTDYAVDESADETDEEQPAAPADARDPRIAAAVARLDALGDRPPAEHVEVYEEVHRVLQESLADATHSTDRADGQPGGAQP